MKTGLIVLIVLVIVALMLGSSFVGRRNQMAVKREAVNAAWAQVDVVLQRRADLIPNLVETVKGYAAHEKGTFEDIAKFRSQAMQATTPDGKAAAENQLSGALKSLLAVAENYPELKASDQFMKLQGSLSQTENSIGNARGYYNQVVRDLNAKTQVFPTNIMAGMFGFQARQYFETTEADREPVAVKF